MQLVRAPSRPWDKIGFDHIDAGSLTRLSGREIPVRAKKSEFAGSRRRASRGLRLQRRRPDPAVTNAKGCRTAPGYQLDRIDYVGRPKA
jgi:hypothetical protein